MLPPALELDPDCVMAHWGIAYGSGPFYNLVWRDFGKAEADNATPSLAFHRLRSLWRWPRARATEGPERHLVEALARRFQEPHRRRRPEEVEPMGRRIRRRHAPRSMAPSRTKPAASWRLLRRGPDHPNAAPPCGTSGRELPSRNADTARGRRRGCASARSPWPISRGVSARISAILRLHIRSLETSSQPERGAASRRPPVGPVSRRRASRITVPAPHLRALSARMPRRRPGSQARRRSRPTACMPALRRLAAQLLRHGARAATCTSSCIRACSWDGVRPRIAAADEDPAGNHSRQTSSPDGQDRPQPAHDDGGLLRDEDARSLVRFGRSQAILD